MQRQSKNAQKSQKKGCKENTVLQITTSSMGANLYPVSLLQIFFMKLKKA